MSVKPVPQVVLSCCTVIVTKGLSSYGIFKSDAPADKVDVLLANLGR